ncbi:MAG: response regulator transcription factor [Burkholderiales bacterium]|nr:response regulator transcription factor [Burkholderiales bacterium]MBH2015523.1 response regulator transcription factor [Burkholderiales bacterium]
MKLLLIDDHPLFRDGLSLLIQHRLNLADHGSFEVLEAGDLPDAARALAAHPDVRLALLDLGLADRQGLGTLDQWRAMAPHVPVVVLSADDRPHTIVSAIDRGASGFIPKTVQSGVMQEALLRVLSGGVYLPPLPDDAALNPELAHDVDAGGEPEPAEPADPESLLGLSDRQLDVLRLLIEGKPNKDICRRLNLSESTVKTHLSAIFRKLRVNSRTQAVVAVARAGVTLNAAPRLG